MGAGDKIARDDLGSEPGKILKYMQFDLETAIAQWIRTLRKHQALGDGEVKEMEIHVRDHIDDLKSQNMSDEAAFQLALKEFGPIQPMAREESWNQIPGSDKVSLLNIPMLRNYFLITTRNFRKYKLYGFVNVFGLTVGLTVVFLIALFVTDELGFDQFHAKKDVLHRVVENQYYAGQPPFPVAVTPTPLGPSLEENYAEVVNSARFAKFSDSFHLGDQIIMENGGALVDPAFFELFSFEFVEGSVANFEERTNSIILNQELAAKYFPKGDPVGELIKLGDEEFMVAGVMENVPKNSHLDFTYVRPMEYYLSANPDRATSWGSNWLYTYIEMDAKVRLDSINDKVKGHIKANFENSVTDIYLQPLTDIYLGTVDFTAEVGRKGQLLYVRVFTIVAIFILLISCINFMNLSTARASKRAKEIGLRKTVGADRAQLVIQFLGESFFLTAASMLLSLIAIWAILPMFNQLSGKEIELASMLFADSGFKWIGLILVVTAVTGLLAGSYPALFLSSLKPADSLKSRITKRGAGGGLRKVLIVFQFAISVVLIIGTLVIYQQLQFIQTVDLGYNKDNIIYTEVPDDKSRTFSSELRQQPAIVNVGLSNRHPAYVFSSSSGFVWPGKDAGEPALLHYMGIDEHYMNTMEMEVMAGRPFVEQDSIGVMVNQKALEVMNLADPVGQVIQAFNDRVIVGVVKNFNFKSIHTPIEPMIVFKLPSPNGVYIRYEPLMADRAILSIKSVWDRVLPDQEFTFTFLDEDFKELYAAEERTSKISSIFAGLAIFISCLGLFGLVSFATEQRTKEIGIRKVLGASLTNLFLALTGGFSKLVLFSLIISIPAGWFAMDQWLQGFAYQIKLTPWFFLGAGTIAILIAFLTVSYQFVGASMTNPVTALKND